MFESMGQIFGNTGVNAINFGFNTSLLLSGKEFLG